MSETKHSPEPWHYVGDNGAIEDDAGNMCAEGWGGEREDANARRIVACVNACQGIPTEALEAGALGKALNLLRLIHTHDDEASDAAAALLRRLGRLP